jgi:hypothetical protein
MAHASRSGDSIARLWRGAQGAQSSAAPLIAALAFALCGCRSAELEEREARALVAGIDALRKAPDPDKAAALDVLVLTPCSVPAVCEVKTRCARAYQIHVEGLRFRADAQALGADDPSRGERLAGAERHLAYATSLAEQCTQHELRMSERLSLSGRRSD